MPEQPRQRQRERERARARARAKERKIVEARSAASSSGGVLGMNLRKSCSSRSSIRSSSSGSSGSEAVLVPS